VAVLPKGYLVEGLKSIVSKYSWRLHWILGLSFYCGEFIIVVQIIVLIDGLCPLLKPRIIEPVPYPARAGPKP
jgi:hypothetical protein